MPVRNYPTAEYLRQCFRYENGKLFWLVRPREHFKRDSAWVRFNNRYSGTEAGSLNKPRNRWKVYFRKTHSIHPCRYNIVWAMHYGEWPKKLDHKNRNSQDDRIENLRESTTSQNNANATKRADNTSGYKGVSYRKDMEKWRARITVNGSKKILGYYDTAEDAHLAYVESAKEHFNEFACSG